MCAYVGCDLLVVPCADFFVPQPNDGRKQTAVKPFFTYIYVRTKLVRKTPIRTTKSDCAPRKLIADIYFSNQFYLIWLCRKKKSDCVWGNFAHIWPHTSVDDWPSLIRVHIYIPVFRWECIFSVFLRDEQNTLATCHKLTPCTGLLKYYNT